MNGFMRAARAIAAGAALMVAAGGEHAARPHDPLAWFSTAQRAAIEEGRAMVDVMPQKHADLSIVGAVSTTADGEDLAAWYREVEMLQRGSYIPLIQRFSNPPRMGDLDALVLDDEELDDLRNCRPGDCELKLSAAEMDEVTAAIRAAGSNWKPAATRAFRGVMLARARAFLAAGFRGAQPYDDHRDRVDLAGEFEVLLDGCTMAGLQPPAVAAYLREYPYGAGDGVESILYWSKDALGDAKPIVGITHVSIFGAQGAGTPVVVASTQVFATHYLTASLSLTSIVTGPDGGGRYLVYARRSRADLFRGPFGRLLRRIVQKRIRTEGAGALAGLRRRLESGPPPALGTTAGGGVHFAGPSSAPHARVTPADALARPRDLPVRGWIRRAAPVRR